MSSLLNSLSPCYFCHNLIPFWANGISGEIIHYGPCSSCKETDQVVSYTTYEKIPNDQQDLLYVHLYLTISEEKKYHARLHLQENKTYLYRDTLSGQIFIVALPGFPLTPVNFREKLKTYLLFI